MPRLRQQSRAGRVNITGIKCLATALLAAILLVSVATASMAQSLPPPRITTGESGLPVPRFVSLATDKTNLRTGPGRRYPILWVFLRPDLPLEVTAEFGVWRRVRDMDGTVGWMHGRLLSGRRHGIVSRQQRVLRAKPEAGARPLLRLQPGVLVALHKCEATSLWCRVEVRGKKGWLQRESIWGTYGGEEIK